MYVSFIMHVIRCVEKTFGEVRKGEVRRCFVFQLSVAPCKSVRDEG
jgi:hypothetical protein